MLFYRTFNNPICGVTKFLAKIWKSLEFLPYFLQIRNMLKFYCFFRKNPEIFLNYFWIFIKSPNTFEVWPIFRKNPEFSRFCRYYYHICFCINPKPKSSVVKYASIVRSWSWWFPCGFYSVFHHWRDMFYVNDSFLFMISLILIIYFVYVVNVRCFPLGLTF